MLDFSNLTLHETKKEEMESQVRTLELEAELTKERSYNEEKKNISKFNLAFRLRLASLRKQHFHLASLVSNEQNGGNGSSES